MDREFSKRMQEKLDKLKSSNEPQPIRSDGAGVLDLGPRNPERAKQLPDTLVPPATDFGLISNLKFSFADAHMTLKPVLMKKVEVLLRIVNLEKDGFFQLIFLIQYKVYMKVVNF